MTKDIAIEARKGYASIAGNWISGESEIYDWFETFKDYEVVFSVVPVMEDAAGFVDPKQAPLKMGLNVLTGGEANSHSTTFNLKKVFK